MEQVLFVLRVLTEGLLGYLVESVESILWIEKRNIEPKYTYMHVRMVGFLEYFCRK